MANRNISMTSVRAFVACTALGLLAGAATRAAAQIAMPTTWTDPSTGLTWAIDEDQHLTDWWSARDYCQSLTFFKWGWRQPTLSELIGIWQGSHFKDGFAFATGRDPLWTSEAEGPHVKVFTPLPTGAVLGTLPRTTPDGIPNAIPAGVGVCVRKQWFWELGQQVNREGKVEYVVYQRP